MRRVDGTMRLDRNATCTCLGSAVGDVLTMTRDGHSTFEDRCDHDTLQPFETGRSFDVRRMLVESRKRGSQEQDAHETDSEVPPEEWSRAHETGREQRQTFCLRIDPEEVAKDGEVCRETKQLRRE